MLSIPYDPALVLGNIVDPKLLDAVLAVSAAAAPADQAHDELNALILSKRSIDMTIQELIGMQIDPAPLKKAKEDLDKRIRDSAVKYAEESIKAQDNIIKARGARASVPVNKSVESPIDYTRSQLKGMNISADTFKMDVQYFGKDKNQENETTHIAQTTSQVSETISGLVGEGFGTFANATADAVGKQMHHQYTKHDIAGTLVIMAGCTHKQAQLFAPFIIDPDKAIKAWNTINPSDRIVRTASAMSKIFAQRDTAEDAKNQMMLLSGATYGSSFVGMVHILNSSETTADEDLNTKMNHQADALSLELAIINITGAYSSIDNVADSTRKMLSQQDIQSHANLVVMGCIPTIQSQQVSLAVQGFNRERTSGDMLADMMNASSGGSEGNASQQTVAAAALSVATGNQLLSVKNAQVKSSLDALATIDDKQNSVINTDSLMIAFTDYVTKCTAGGDTFGVPINYYLKPIPKSYIAALWLSKYYPQLVAGAQGENDQVAGAEKKG